MRIRAPLADRRRTGGSSWLLGTLAGVGCASRRSWRPAEAGRQVSFTRQGSAAPYRMDGAASPADEAQFELSLRLQAMQSNEEARMPLVPGLPRSTALRELDLAIRQCRQACNEKADESWEGHCAPEQLEFLRHFVSGRFAGHSSRPLRMCQVGFNAGHSAVALLEHAPVGSILLSLDLAKHSYTRPLEKLVQGIATARGSTHVLLVGDSAEMLPKFLRIPFDLVFIDGNHAYEAVTLDIWHCLLLASRETVLLVNHIYTDMTEGLGPTRAWLDAVRRGHAEQRGWHSCCSRHGIAIGACIMPRAGDDADV